MDVAVFIGRGHQLGLVVDFSHSGYGKAAQVGLNQKGLGFVVGNTSDSQCSLQLVQIPVKFRTEGGIFYIVDGPCKALAAVYGHSASLCPQMGVIVHSEKQVQGTAVF